MRIVRGQARRGLRQKGRELEANVGTTVDERTAGGNTMQRISETDLRVFSEACRLLYQPGLTLESHSTLAFRFLRQLVAAEYVGCGVLDQRTGQLNIGLEIEHPAFPRVMEAYAALMGQYPLFNFDEQVNGGRPFTRAHFFSPEQFRNLDIFQEVYVPMDVDNHCALYVPTRPHETLFYFIERKSGPDYSERDLTLLEMAQEQLANAYQLARFHAPEGDDEAIDVYARAGLTPREAEVLRWMAVGKSNIEIGDLLGLKLSTVKGYVASIFDKLGVDNRFAAIMYAMRLKKTQAARANGKLPPFTRVRPVIDSAA